METFSTLLDMLVHIDKYLDVLIHQYGSFSYMVLFAIVFLETGLVLLPFLPGDSLLFLAGSLAATGAMNPVVLSLLLWIAAVIGNSVNYSIGAWVGPKIFESNTRWFNQQALRTTHDFYKKYGGQTIMIARFIPVIRTFAPFVAGISRMNIRIFQFYNSLGAFIWTVGLVMLGYYFGNLPWIKDRLNLIILVGIGAAVIPVLLGGLWKIIQSLRDLKK